jgi:hypothetical protein
MTIGDDNLRIVRYRKAVSVLARVRLPKEILEETVGSMVSGQRSNRDVALDELIDVCLENDDTRYLVEQHVPSVDPRSVLRQLYSNLLLAGAGQSVNGVYVAAGTLFLPQPLAFALSRQKPTDFGRPAFSFHANPVF